MSDQKKNKLGKRDQVYEGWKVWVVREEFTETR